MHFNRSTEPRKGRFTSNSQLQAQGGKPTGGAARTPESLDEGLFWFAQLTKHWSASAQQQIYAALRAQRCTARNARIRAVARRNNRHFIGAWIYRELGNSFIQLAKEWPI